MATLLTLEQAVAQLNLVEPESDVEVHVEAKLAQATAIIMDYLKSRADDAWTPTTAPGAVIAATALMLTHLYEHRGDDQKTDADVWMAIERLLVRYRDPALA